MRSTITLSLLVFIPCFGLAVAQTNSVKPAAGTREMRRIADRNTPAHRAAKKFLRGANLGNYLEAPPGQDWGAKYCGIFAKADFLVTNALNQGLNVIVNLHHFDEFTSDPAAHTNKFYALWRQIAAHYAKSPDGVALELLNEPKDAATTIVLNPIYAETIRQIRRIDPQRAIFVGPGKWNQVSELPNLRLPDNDENLIVTVHCYDPFYFTHQGASWAGNDVKSLKDIVFPGPPATPFVPDPAAQLSRGVLDWIQRYNTLPAEKNPSSPIAFRRPMQQAKEWSDYYGRPMHVGEFGCYVGADPVSRARFYGEFRKVLDEFKLGWAMWDWKAGFKYWDDKTGQPAPGLREAFFPQKK